MKPPRIVIVGRPNVGKSSLLNALASRRVSIVDDVPGVTRDRVCVRVSWPGRKRHDPPRTVEVIDTGGYGFEDPDDLSPAIERQIASGVAMADVVLFVVDARAGVTTLDERIARLLRKTNPGVPVLMVANKTDDHRHETDALDAASLGFGMPLAVSAITRHNFAELRETVAENLPEESKEAPDADDPDSPLRSLIAGEGIRLAIVGKRNAGKSTLVNALAGEERVIVSEVAGTTRDSVDVRIEVPMAPDNVSPDDDPADAEDLPGAEMAEDFRSLDTFDELAPQDELDDSAEDGSDDASFEGPESVDVTGEFAMDDDAWIAAGFGSEFGDDPDAQDDSNRELNAGGNDGRKRPAPEYRPEMIARLPRTLNNDVIFTLIDTAGMRRRKSVSGDIEYYALHRSLRSIRRADVVVHVLDATTKISNVDQKLVAEIARHERPLVLVVNKWDLVGEKDLSDADAQATYAEYLDRELRLVRFAPIVFTAAIDADGVREVLEVVASLWLQARHRAGTGELNRAIEGLYAERRPRSKAGKLGKIFFASQIGVDPPTIALQVNNTDHFDNNYQLFMLNRLRDSLACSEVPIRLSFRGKEKRYKKK